MALREWATKEFARVSTDEAAKLATIRLNGDGNQWETWTAPFPDLEQFLVEAEAMKLAIADECPIRRVALTFTAETASGATLAQYPTSVQGKNKQADALAGSGNAAAKAFAEAMEGMSRVMVGVLKSAEIQVATVTRTLESQATQIHDLIEYHRVKQELELTEQKANSSAQDMVMEQVKTILPMIPDALELWIASKKSSPVAAAAVAAVKTVATNITNGASP